MATSSQSGNNATIRRVKVVVGESVPLVVESSVLTVHHRSSQFTYHIIHTFHSKGFVYLLTVQPEFPAVSAASGLVTRLVRLCARDETFTSYTQLTLQCRRTITDIAAPATAAQLSSQVRLLL